MKKIKLLTSLTTLTTFTTCLPLASCGNNNIDITVDESAKTQTFVNGLATYTFKTNKNISTADLGKPVLLNTTKLEVVNYSANSSTISVTIGIKESDNDISNESKTYNFGIKIVDKNDKLIKQIDDLKLVVGQSNIKLLINGTTTSYTVLSDCSFKELKQYYEISEPTKDHYYLLGWFNKDTGDQINDSTILSKDMTIEAKFNKLVQISFENTEGVELSSTSTIEVKPGTKASEITNFPTVTIAAGYVKVGWYNSTTSQWINEETDPEVTKDSKIRCVAISENNLCYPKISVAGETATEYACKKGWTLKELLDWYGIENTPDPFTDKIFDKWCYNNGEEIKLTDTVSESETVVINATYVDACYVSYTHSEGITFTKEFSNKKVKKGSLMTASMPTDDEITVESEYTKIGWYNQQTWEKVEDLSTAKITSNSSYMCCALPNSDLVDITITLDSSFKTYTGLKNWTFGEFREYWNIKEPSKEKYDFQGWYVGSTKIDDTYVLASNTTIEARFMPQEDPFTNDTWANVVETANKGLVALKQKYGEDSFIGKTRTITLNNQKMICKVIGEEHDTLSNGSGKAALTFQVTTLYSDTKGRGLHCRFKEVEECKTSIADSELMSNLNDLTKQKLTKFWFISSGSAGSESDINYSILFDINHELNDLFDGIKSVKKEAYTYDEDGNQSETPVSYDAKLFIPTIREMAIEDKNINEGTPYEYWNSHKTSADRIITDGQGVAQYYWLATTREDGGNSHMQYFINDQGVLSRKVSSTPYGAVSFCFCI